ncbi:MAG: type I-F CRISPR-associated endoribonuclease Cas6/Csy4 [Gammaproteobacteria bacterium]|nr:MAG: type I-F CRISPR-associated endoribonuclease Cas6/Csy4 [Gammaproteobacteria bacterium]
MKSYVDITLLPNADIALYFLWEKVYQQIHIALVEAQDGNGKVNIGVSWPEYDSEKFQLGSKLRILAASSENIEALNLRSWLARLSDYVHITLIRPVPVSIDGYAVFKRIQLKSNNERLARRRAKRKKTSLEEALAYFGDRKEVYSRAPYIRLRSHSSGKRYRLFIAKEETDTTDMNEGFSTYGLSSKSSVPLF